MSKIAEAYVEVRLDTKKAKSEGKASVSSMGKDLGGSFASAFGAAAIGAGIAKSIGAASDLNETVSKTQVVFGESGKAVTSWADNSAKQFGLSKRAALDAVDTFAIFGQGAGLAGTDLTDFSQKLVGLSADLASFSNTSPEQAIDAIGAALRGESEPIRQYGVLLDDATLKARAMTMGLYDGKGALDQHSRVLAAQAEILAQTTKAQGDFARTADGAANSQRIAKAEAEDAAASLGQNFLPIYQRIVQIVGDAAHVFGELPAPVQTSVVALAALVVLAGPISKVVDVAKDLTTAIKSVMAASSGLGAVASGVLAASALAGAAILVYKALSDEKTRLAKITNTYVDALNAEAGGQKDAIDSATAKLIADNHLLDSATKLKLSAADLAKVVRGEQVPAYEAVRDRLEELVHLPADVATKKLGDEFGITLGEATRFTSGVDDLTDSLTKATKTVTDQDVAQRSVTEAIGEAHRETAGLTRATAESTEASGKQSAANEEQGRTADRSAASTKRQQETMDDLKKATEDLIDTLRGVVDGTRDYERAQDDAQGAVAAYVETEKDKKSTMEDVDDAARDAADAIIAQSEAYGTLNGASLNSRDGIQRQIDSLTMQATTLAEGSPLRMRIEEYIAALRRIPTSITTGFSITGDSVITQRNGRDRRAAGGPTRRSEIYEVVERHQPEMYEENGRSYLLPGGDGQVTPMTPGGGTSSRSGAGFPDSLTLIIEGSPFTALLDRRDRELVQQLMAGVRP